MKKIKKAWPIFLTVLCFAVNQSFGQTVLLEVDRSTDSIAPTRGPNLKKFSYGFLYFGFVAGEDKPGAKIIYGNSVDFGIGARKKYKISPLYSLGWELGSDTKIFKLKQSDGKIFPDTILNNAERIEYSSLYISFFNRFNFDNKRGNFMGTFLDVGINGEWDLSITHIIKNSLPDGSDIQSTISGLPYVNRFNYNMFARLGRSHLSVYASYRLSKLFKSSYSFPELPALTIGLDLGIFRQ